MVGFSEHLGVWGGGEIPTWHGLVGDHVRRAAWEPQQHRLDLGHALSPAHPRHT